jgi:hypothetical protein
MVTNTVKPLRVLRSFSFLHAYEQAQKQGGIVTLAA